jgi:DNA repair exonuclease SbcCD nuclease subunit
MGGRKRLRVGVLGDPHLGRRFVNNVPLHRRGDREKLVRDCFRDHFADIPRDLHVHVCMGDIFDRPHVGAEDILLAYETYAYAVGCNPNTLFVLIAGNHDLARDNEAQVSFDVLARLLETLEVLVVRDEPIHHAASNLLFVPFSTNATSTDVVDGYTDVPCAAAFGHWDIVTVHNDSNKIPETLNTKLVVTGHDHVARELDRGDVHIICTGSMQPYTHGEDPKGLMYRTVTLPELELISEAERRMLNLRVVLAEGESLPPDLDALSIQSRRVGQEEGGAVDVSFEDFDMAKLFAEAMNDNGVGAELQASLFEEYRARG